MSRFAAALESRRSQGRGDYSPGIEGDEKAQALRDALASERVASSDQKEITLTPKDAPVLTQKIIAPAANISSPTIGTPLQTANENPTMSQQERKDNKDKEDEPTGSAILNGLMRRFQL